jgi:hypothetical protein
MPLLIGGDKMEFYNQPSWAGIIGMWLLALALFAVNFFINILLGVFVGGFVSWLFSLTCIGTWICEGINIIGGKLQPENLYQLGAALGFISGFFKFSFTVKKS